MAPVVKNPSVNAGGVRDTSSIPGSGRSPGRGMATHSSILAWRIPWTEEPGGLQSMGSHTVRHEQATEHTHTHRGLGPHIKNTKQNQKVKQKQCCNKFNRLLKNSPYQKNKNKIPLKNSFQTVIYVHIFQYFIPLLKAKNRFIQLAHLPCPPSTEDITGPGSNTLIHLLPGHP